MKEPSWNWALIIGILACFFFWAYAYYIIFPAIQFYAHLKGL